MHRANAIRLVVTITLALLICVVAGCGLGMEKHAKTGNPLMHIRDDFEFKYPGNWTIDTTDSDYDPDQNIIIESPGNSIICLLFVKTESDPRENVEEMMGPLRELMKSPEKTEFSQWGQYNGYGVKLEGRILGVRITGKFFSYSGNGVTFMVALEHPNEDYSDVSPGFEQIARTFKLK